MMKRILMVGLDVTLAESRATMLAEHYETMAAEPSEALFRLRSRHFDLMLVCYTTSREQALEIIHNAHEEFPKLCILHLRIVSQQVITLPVVHRLVTLNYDPDGWVKAIDELLSHE